MNNDFTTIRILLVLFTIICSCSLSSKNISKDDVVGAWFINGNEFDKIPLILNSDGSGKFVLASCINSTDGVTIDTILTVITWELNDIKTTFGNRFNKIQGIKAVEGVLSLQREYPKDRICTSFDNTVTLFLKRNDKGFLLYNIDNETEIEKLLFMGQITQTTNEKAIDRIDSVIQMQKKEYVKKSEPIPEGGITSIPSN